jgi:hypothetical protein
MERKMANATDYNRWGPPSDDRASFGIRSPWHIVLIVLGFMFWWPVGLAVLFYTLGSRKMGCFGRSENKLMRMQDKVDRLRSRMERHGFGGGNFGSGFGFGPPSSGNRAFDEYRSETLRRLEEEQHEFKDFLERLRHAKDKDEFDQFMSQHKRPTPPADNGQPQG